MKILVGELSAITRSIEKELFGFNSFFSKIEFARSWEEILQQVKENRPDGIILDESLVNEKTLDSAIAKIKTLGIKTILTTDKKNFKPSQIPNIKITQRNNIHSATQEQLKKYSKEIQNIFEKINFHPSFISKKTEIPEEIKTPSSKKIDYKVVLIGVSTGGPGTIQKLLLDIGKNFPVPILVTQHIDSNFDKNLIEWLNSSTGIPVHLAENNMVAQNGHVYFAPADYHLLMKINLENKITLELNHDEQINFLRPAVDKMFFCASNLFKEKCIAVLLTGMGSDGAAGCWKIKQAGGYTITESEESCVIYGMPQAAFKAGGSTEVLNLKQIAKRLKELLGV